MGLSSFVCCARIQMIELIKNIGLGLFVNGSFALLNGVFTTQSFLITILSVAIMAMCICIERRSK